MPKIESIFAFIAVDREPDDEGIVAAYLNGSWMPLVGADPARVESLRPIAKQVAQTTGKKVTLARFKVREDLELI